MIKDNYIRVKLEQLVPNPWNPNEQTDFMFEKEINSIQKNGFLLPILVREKNGMYEIIDGEHRFKAARQIGMEEVSVNNLGAVSDAVAKQLTIIMNETKGKPNQDKLSKMLNDLKDEVDVEELIKNLPYQEDEIKSMITHVEVDWTKIQPLPEPEKKESNPVLEQPEIKNSEYKHDGRVVGENSGMKVLTVKIPVEEMNELEAQLDRIKRLMYPDNDPSEVSDEHAWIAVVQALVQTEDEFFENKGDEDESSDGD